MWGGKNFGMGFVQNEEGMEEVEKEMRDVGCFQ